MIKDLHVLIRFDHLQADQDQANLIVLVLAGSADHLWIKARKTLEQGSIRRMEYVVLLCNNLPQHSLDSMLLLVNTLSA